MAVRKVTAARRRATKQAVKQAGKERLKRLPASKNGAHRKQASLGCYQYQKDELRRRAKAEGMTVSRYLNELLWKDWV
jgi:hypothetical protein